MADSWEDYDDDAGEPIAVAQGAYDPEGEDEILDSWENELDEGSADGKAKPAAVPKKKKPLQQIIEERKVAEEKRQRELAEKKAQMEQELNEDPLERKRRMEKLQLERDLENAADLFGTNDADEGSVTESMSTMQLGNAPQSKSQFDAIAKTISDQILQWKSKPSLYVPFLEKLFRELADPLDFSDIRKLSSVLSTLSNEKQRQEKEKKAGKKATTKKSQIRVEAGEATNGGYDDYGDYDDFM